ncbi:MAG: hypothetical protein KBA61_05930 [Spirochaetes bacterium]|jgi:hypothetical protein|nr:hypothetical protein [Spirochaetota bacterium]
MRGIIPTTLLIFISAAATTAFSEPVVERARALYERAKSLEDSGEQNTQSVTLNMMLPAVGLKTMRFRFTTESTQVDPRNDPFLFNRRLAKVTMEYNISAAVLYHVEHLYDEKERHVFTFWREKYENGIPPTEVRYYFNGKKIAMIIADRAADEGKTARTIKSGNYTAAEIRQGVDFQRKADAYLKHFRNMMKIENVN